MRLLHLHEKVSVKRTGYRFAVHVLTVFVLSVSPMTLFAQQAESDNTSFELDVMTFNIRSAEGQDGNNSWPMRKERVVETMRAVDPDVLGLQGLLRCRLTFCSRKCPSTDGWASTVV
jgi:hypothetical protein